ARDVARHDAVQPMRAAQVSAAAELAFALHWAQEWAQAQMSQAARLIHTLPATYAMFRDGRLSQSHADRILGAVRDLDPEVTVKVEARVLDRAPRQTASEFARSVRRAVAALDTRDAEQQHEAAAELRRVCYEPDEHAMAWINTYLSAADARAAMIAIQA